jgi:pyruvate dehydrogenase E2 component (dihydrolipoamide acetyltransferase)
MIDFRLPELGENVEKGDVVRVLVAVGDAVKIDQPLLELETDKATIEVPSSVTGVVAEVGVRAGDKVKVGQVVLRFSNADAAAPPSAAAAAPPAALPTPAAPAIATVAGPRPASRPADVVDIHTGRHGPPADPAPRHDAGSGAAVAAAAAALPTGGAVPAAPSVRRYARELGVDLAEVRGTGPGGRIGPDDVNRFVKGALAAGSATSRGPGLRSALPLPDFARWGPIDVRPMSSIRRKTAEHLSVAWQAPHVTQHDKADITELEAFREAYGKRLEQAGGKLTVTAIVIKVLAVAIKRFPEFATSVDMAGEALVFKQYVHIGVAVDTPNGLLVPVIRDVDRKTITEIAVELAALSQKARDRKLSLEEMSGGVFSVSNLGGIGGTSFTPIVNQPEVAILGLSRGAMEPVWRSGQFVPRQMLPLSLSYDHRVIDGANAARFLRVVVEALEQPLSLML